ncbi:MAG TPA: hypothetical protein VGN07_05740 [Steroidobacteraceae bacterium]|jgi:hypothetical protein
MTGLRTDLGADLADARCAAVTLDLGNFAGNFTGDFGGDFAIDLVAALIGNLRTDIHSHSDHLTVQGRSLY